ncbi:hypothetical protein GCM10027168_41740 [Streptomyces capparidis]
MSRGVITSDAVSSPAMRRTSRATARRPSSAMGERANSHHPNHAVQTRALHAYLRRRNNNARHPDVLAAQRRERARIRSERGLHWGGRPLPAAA